MSVSFASQSPDFFFLGGGHQPSNQTQNLQEKLSRSLSREIALTHPAALSFLRSKV